MSLALLILPILLLSCYPYSGHASAKALSSSELLAKICNFDEFDWSPMLTSIEEVRGLIKAFKEEANQICPDKYALKYEPAYLELEDILSDEYLGDICSEESLDYIELYHIDFIHYYSPKIGVHELRRIKKMPRNERTQPIPHALYRFFVTFVKHVSAKCREMLPIQFNRLVNETGLITDEDFRLLDEIKQKSGIPLKKLRSKLAKLVMNDSIEKLRANHGLLYNYALPEESNLTQLKEVCLRRLKPVYDEALMPVVRLNELGYSGKSYDSIELRQLLKTKHMTRWFEAFQMCESIRLARLFVIPEQVCKDRMQMDCYGFVDQEFVDFYEEDAAEEFSPREKNLRWPQVHVEHLPRSLDKNLARIYTNGDVLETIKEFQKNVKKALAMKTNRLLAAEAKMNAKLMSMLKIQPLPKAIFNEDPMLTSKISLFFIGIFVSIGYLILSPFMG